MPGEVNVNNACGIISLQRVHLVLCRYDARYPAGISAWRFDPAEHRGSFLTERRLYD